MMKHRFRFAAVTAAIVSFGSIASVWAAAPNAPSNLSANSSATNRIDLAWSDNSNTETGYKVERSGSYAGPWTVISTLGPNSHGYSDTGLPSDHFYAYRVRAFNGSLYSDYSNVSGDTTRDTKKTSTTKSTSTTTKKATTTSTTKPTTTSKPTTTTVKGGDDHGGGSTTVKSTTVKPTTTTTTKPTTTTSVKPTTSTTVKPTTTSTVGGGAPNPPWGFGLTVISCSSIKLQWKDASSDEDGFKIERSESSGGPFTQIATVGPNSTSYTAAGLSGNTTYYFRVRAYKGGSNSPYTPIRNATTTSCSSWDGSSVRAGTSCSIDGSTISASVCNAGSGNMSGSSTWELYYAPYGNAKYGSVVCSGTFGPLNAGQCTTVSCSQTAGGNYIFKFYQSAGHPGTGVAWSRQCTKDNSSSSTTTSTVVTGGGQTTTTTSTVFDDHGGGHDSTSTSSSSTIHSTSTTKPTTTTSTKKPTTTVKPTTTSAKPTTTSSIHHDDHGDDHGHDDHD